MEKHEEIDLAEVLRRLWIRRKFIIKVAAAAVIIGLVLALTGRVKYTASTVMVPQIGKGASAGNLQGLAAMAGINLGVQEQADLLSPTVYPMVVRSVPFQKDLMHSAVITSADNDEPITILDYFAESGSKGSLLGLPGRLIGAMRKKDSSVSTDSLPLGISSLTPMENACRNRLSKLISVTVNEKNGYITLSATMPQALMAARVAARAQELLQEYVTRFKIQKVQADLDFIEERYREVKADFEAKQRALATFRDANRSLSSAVALTRENSLANEYDLAFTIYSEMARQREQAGIKVKEDTPVFTIIEPVTVPMVKSAPRRAFILAVSLLLGLFVGCGLALMLPLSSDLRLIRRRKES